MVLPGATASEGHTAEGWGHGGRRGLREPRTCSQVKTSGADWCAQSTHEAIGGRRNFQMKQPERGPATNQTRNGPVTVGKSPTVADARAMPGMGKSSVPVVYFLSGGFPV